MALNKPDKEGEKRTTTDEVREEDRPEKVRLAPEESKWDEGQEGHWLSKGKANKKQQQIGAAT